MHTRMPTQTQPLASLWIYFYLKTIESTQIHYLCTYVLNEEVSALVISARALVAAFAESEVVRRAIVLFEIKHPIGLCPDQTCMYVCVLSFTWHFIHVRYGVGLDELVSFGKLFSEFFRLPDIFCVRSGI